MVLMNDILITLLQTLIFTDTKRECDNLSFMLNRMNGPRSASIHGDKDQRERERVLADFRSSKIMILGGKLKLTEINYKLMNKMNYK